MSWQSVARGGILHMHRGVIPRPAGVTSMQNQLRRLCLSTSSTPLHPKIQGALTIRSLAQSRSFATAPADENNAEKPKAKKAKKPKASKRKPLTEEQLARKKLKEDRATVSELKKTALKPPKKLPSVFYTLALQAKMPELQAQAATVGDAFRQAPALIKNIEGEEKKKLEDQVQANIIANAEAHEAWIKSHTPLQIKQANVARRTLYRVWGKTKYSQLQDDRLIKKPMSAYTAYTAERLAASEFNGQGGKETLLGIAREWKNVSEAEKERYQEIATKDKERYLREHVEVYGYSPRSAKKEEESDEV